MVSEAEPRVQAGAIAPHVVEETTVYGSQYAFKMRHITDFPNSLQPTTYLPQQVQLWYENVAVFLSNDALFLELF